MPIVTMPDGAQVQFPDDMPADQIKAMILTKFPDAGQTAQPSPTAPAAAEQPWNAPGSLVPIQFQQGTGAARLAMPSIISDTLGALQAPKDALDGKYNQLEIDPNTGEPSPFDPRLADDASALASVITPGSVASRIGTPIAEMAGRRVAKVATPDIDELYAVKDAAYKTVDQLGARYSPQSIDDMTGDMISRAAQSGISPDRHPKAYSMLVDWEKRGPQGMSLTELDQMRQVVRRDLVEGGDAAEGHFGREFISAIDDFIDTATPAKISGVTGQTADYAIRTARKANMTLRKSERLQDAMNSARLRAAASGSGGNIDNAIRQELVRIIKKPENFTPAEIAQMEQIVAGGGRGQELLRKIGKLSPSGNGLMAALGLGATMTNPAMAVGPAAGLVAKTLSDRATQKGVEGLTSTVRNGGAQVAAKMPYVPSPMLPKALGTLVDQNVRKPLPLPLPPGVLMRLET